MGKAFSKSGTNKNKKRAQVTETDKAILALKTQRRKLGEYQRQIQEKVVSAVEKAQKCIVQKDKRSALFALKQKKLFEIRLGEVDTQLITVEELLCNIDQAKQNNKVFEALQTGNEALKEIQAKVSVSALQQLVEDTELVHEHEATVNELLEREHIDMENLEEELEHLEIEVQTEDLPEVPKVALPKLQEKEQNDDKPEIEESVAEKRKAEEPLAA